MKKNNTKHNMHNVCIQGVPNNVSLPLFINQKLQDIHKSLDGEPPLFFVLIKKLNLNFYNVF